MFSLKKNQMIVNSRVYNDNLVDGFIIEISEKDVKISLLNEKIESLEKEVCCFGIIVEYII